MTIGENIRKCRKEHGMTQKDLAALLGITFQTVGQWERNECNPKADTLVKLATALNVDVSELTGKSTFKSAEEFKAEWNRLIAADNGDNEIKIVHGVVPLTSEQMRQFVSDINHMSPEGVTVAMDRIHELAQIPYYQK